MGVTRPQACKASAEATQPKQLTPMRGCEGQQAVAVGTHVQYCEGCVATSNGKASDAKNHLQCPKHQHRAVFKDLSQRPLPNASRRRAAQRSGSGELRGALAQGKYATSPAILYHNKHNMHNWQNMTIRSLCPMIMPAIMPTIPSIRLIILHIMPVMPITMRNNRIPVISIILGFLL